MVHGNLDRLQAEPVDRCVVTGEQRDDEDDHVHDEQRVCDGRATDRTTTQRGAGLPDRILHVPDELVDLLARILHGVDEVVDVGFHQG